MKVCPKCKAKYSDELAYCTVCGYKLSQMKRLNKNKAIIIGIVCLVAFLGIGVGLLEQKRISDVRKRIDKNAEEKALEEYRNTPTIRDIQINGDWTVSREGDYLYIRGSVTNVSSTKTISYYEVEAKFLDEYGDVIDSDWTNSGDDLEPGESRKFEIMHECSFDEDDVKLSIKDVK